LAKDDLVGVLTLYSSNREGFSAEHERVIEIISRQVSPVMKLAADFAADKAHSFRDQLTGLPNVEQFVQFSKSAQLSGSGSIAPAALLLIDVDNLTQINTNFGRRTGDAVLNHVVDAARRLLRTSDVLFRYEDDQFIAVLLHTAESAASAFADRLSKAVSGSRGQLSFDVTVTVSIAVAPNDSSTFEGLLQVARERHNNRPPPEDGRHPSNRIH
jgi:diguanylate cyclase (GGDEF)-like protein